MEVAGEDMQRYDAASVSTCKPSTPPAPQPVLYRLIFFEQAREQAQQAYNRDSTDASVGDLEAQWTLRLCQAFGLVACMLYCMLPFWLVC